MKREFENVLLLIQGIVRRLFYSDATQPPGRIQRVLVFQSSKLGDMVCTTPVLSAIKASNPTIYVTVMGNRVNQELLDGHPDVDEYLTWEPSNLRRIRTLMKRGRFDAGILVAQNFRALASMFTAGIPFISALHVFDAKSPNETISYRLLLKYVCAVPVSNYRYIPREYLRLLEPLGIISDDVSKTLAVEERARVRALGLFNEKTRPLFGIVPSAGNKIKEWLPERFAHVADDLMKKKRVTIVLLGGPGDIQLCDVVLAKMVRRGEVINLCGQLDIEMLKAVIGQLDLLIAADTGPIHIGHALGVATVDIAGAVDEHVIPPRGPRNIVVVPERDRAELFVMTARVFDKVRVREQMDAVTVPMVIDAIDRHWGNLMNSARPKSGTHAQIRRATPENR